MDKTGFPETLLEAIRYYSDQDTCIRYVAALRWPNGPECPTCGAASALHEVLRELSAWPEPRQRHGGSIQLPCMHRAVIGATESSISLPWRASSVPTVRSTDRYRQDRPTGTRVSCPSRDRSGMELHRLVRCRERRMHGASSRRRPFLGDRLRRRSGDGLGKCDRALLYARL